MKSEKLKSSLKGIWDFAHTSLSLNGAESLTRVHPCQNSHAVQ